MPSPPVASLGPMSDVRLSDLKKSAQMFFSLIMQHLFLHRLVGVIPLYPLASFTLGTIHK